jgi:hypothetical protein
MKTKKALRFTIIGISALSLLVPTLAQSERGKVEYELLFSHLVTAEGPEYFKTRKQLLEHGHLAIPFVTSQLANSNLQTRVIARALLEWIAEGPLNETRTTNLLTWVDAARQLQSGPAAAVGGYARCNLSHNVNFPPHMLVTDISRRFPSYDTAAAYLMEVTMKGLDPEGGTFVDIDGRKQVVSLQVFRSSIPGHPSNQDVAQAVAAALLAGNEDKDAIEVLKLLYNERGGTMRRVAAIGLKRAGIETDEPLDKPVDWWW